MGRRVGHFSPLVPKPPPNRGRRPAPELAHGVLHRWPQGMSATSPRTAAELGTLGEDTGMRLAWKLIVALVVSLALILAISGWAHVRREVQVFETDMRRDHEAVARVLQPSLTAAWRRG